MYVLVKMIFEHIPQVHINSKLPLVRKAMLDQLTGGLEGRNQALALPRADGRKWKIFCSSGLRMPLETRNEEIQSAYQNAENSGESLPQISGGKMNVPGKTNWSPSSSRKVKQVSIIQLNSV